MRRYLNLRVLIVASLALFLLLAACSGFPGLGSLPKMATYQGETFTVEYPEEWQHTSDSMFGIEFALFSTQSLTDVDVLGMDINALLKDGMPLVIIMTAPKELAGDLNADDPEAFYEELMANSNEEDVTILKKGETTIGGAQGYQLVLKGYNKDLDRDVGGYVLAAQREDDGQVVLFIGITSRDNIDQDLRIFEHMHKTFAFTK